VKQGFGRHHPLAIPRQATVLALCKALGWLDDASIARCPLPEVATLTRLHDAEYVKALEVAAQAMLVTPTERNRFNIGTMECPLFDGLWDRARATVGGSIEAAASVASGGVAFHPAGGTHHGQRGRASGFCFFNDPAFAILAFLDQGRERVAYLDVDAHHGDGVENLFAHDARVTTISLHEAGRWPGTGATGDRREGRALNMAVPPRINDSEWRSLIDSVVLPALRALEPDALVVTCGVDALAGDPLSTMALSNGVLVDAVIDAAACSPRTVVCGGGGYNPWTLARAWTLLWGRLCDRPIPDRLPEAAQAVLAPLDCDLVEADERPEHWFTTLLDPPNEGAIRPEIRKIANSALWH
jgi:acetoin utilization protein AcuC